MGDRCTGACCLAFPLPRPPEELWKNYEAWRRHRRGLDNGSGGAPLIYDIHLIAPMVEYLGYSDTTMFEAADPPRNPPLESPARQRYWYRCKLYDAKNKVCTIYAYRPKMCRDYPYGQACEHAACTWDAALKPRPAEVRSA